MSVEAYRVVQATCLNPDVEDIPMTVRFTVNNLLVNGKPVVSRKDERKQLAMMMKRELGMV